VRRRADHAAAADPRARPAGAPARGAALVLFGSRAERDLGFRPQFTLRETIRSVLGERPWRAKEA